MSKDSSCIFNSEERCSTQEIEFPFNSPITNSFLKSIFITLMDVISNNHFKDSYNHKLKVQSKQQFTSKKIQKISLGDYLSRIIKYTKIDNSTLIMALIYTDRFCKNNKIFLTEFNVQWILFSAIIIAIKYNEDKYYSDLYYTKIGGLKLKKLNKLEMKFLIWISFKLFIDLKDYEKYETILCSNLNEFCNN